ncbi:MAG: hypothetical protein PHS44_00285 [Candidatus Dojkabacteria bacterium]|nr:hypothetical protein [Candidatus Dojkabacteria bacterium]
MAEKIFIDLDEELIFIIERLKKVEDDRVILVVPERAAVLGSSVSLKLLFSEVSKTGKRAIIVTKDTVGKKLAQKANFIVVDVVNDISEKQWEQAEASIREYKNQLEDRKDALVDERNERPIVDETKEVIPSPVEKPLIGKLEPKKVNIDGFEMVSGGDIAKFAEAEDIDEQGYEAEKEISEDKIGDLEPEDESLSVKENRLVGKDMSAYKYSKASSVSKTPKPEGRDSLKAIGGVFESIKSKLFIGGNKKILIAVVAVIIVFFGLSYFVFPKAQVIIKVESQDIEIQKEVIADTSVNSLDIESLTIPATLLEVTRDRSDSADTTEKKKTGEIASGQISLFNLTDDEVKITSGTVVEAVETGLKYTMNTDVTIDATESGDFGITYGTVDVGITATEFGEEYNITDKKDFRVAGFDVEQVYGKNFNNITGGTTEEVRYVSQKDYDGLKKSLVASLKEDLRASMKEEAGVGRELLEDTIKYKVINEAPSPGVDAEADNFTLSVTMKATALSFSKEDIDQVAEVLVEKENSQNVDVEEFEYEAKVKESSGEKITIDLKITGVVTPSVNEDELKDRLSNQSEKKAREYLDSLDGVQVYEIAIEPAYLPGFLKHFPSSVARIEVTIEKV